MRRLAFVIILLLYSIFADGNSENEFDWFRASKNGSIEVISHLLNSGLVVDLCDINGDTALIFAVWQGHTAITHKLISIGANPNIQSLIDGRTPLIIASEYGDLETVTALINHGADVNHQDMAGKTSLIWAVKHDRYKVAEKLLSSGANKSLFSKDGRTAMQWAADYNRDGLVQLLVNGNL